MSRLPLRRSARPGLFQRLRADFLAGLVIVLPAALTVALLAWAIRLIDSRIDPLLPGWPPFQQVAGLGVIVFVAVVIGVGAFARGYAGRHAVRLVDALAARVPVVRRLYGGLKQIAETVAEKGGTSFRQICLVEYPERGIWTVVAITSPAEGELLSKTGEDDLVGILVPTAPNPITGFLVFAPRRDLRPLDISIENAAKLILSAGLVGPPGYAAEPPDVPRPAGR